MKNSTKLRYVSMTVFIIGYVGVSTYVDPLLLLFIMLAVVGFTSITDVIRLEDLERQVEEHKAIAKDVTEALERMDNVLNEQMSEPEEVKNGKFQ